MNAELEQSAISISEEEMQQRLDNIQRQRSFDAVQKISQLCRELGVEIVAVPKLIEIAPGVSGIVCDWGVKPNRTQ